MEHILDPNITLSLCIPTYNRGKVVFDLVKKLTEIKSGDIEIVVTNTASPDDTASLLSGITDPRVKVYNYDFRMIAAENMMECLFMAKGKYAVFCNDRDVLVPSGIEKLLTVLRERDDFAVIKTSDRNGSGKMKEYSPGIEAVTHLKFTGHPTGMVFNRRLMTEYDKTKYYPKNNGDSLLVTLYSHCCLSYDLCKTGKGKLGLFGVHCWSECHQSFKIKNISGIGVGGWAYYLPKTTERLTKETFLFTATRSVYGDPEKAISVDTAIFEFYLKRSFLYKELAFSKYEPVHYGLKREFVTTAKLIKAIRHFYTYCESLVSEDIVCAESLENFKAKNKNVVLKTVKYSLKTDLVFLKRGMRNLIKKIGRVFAAKRNKI